MAIEPNMPCGCPCVPDGMAVACCDTCERNMELDGYIGICMLDASDLVSRLRKEFSEVASDDLMAMRIAYEVSECAHDSRYCSCARYKEF